MVKRTTARRAAKRNPAEEELTAPVAFKTEAIIAADNSGLPMTIFRVVDREDCRWFQVAHCYWTESDTVRVGGLQTAGLITYLPRNYFVR